MTVASTLGLNETQYATDDCLEEIINNTRAVRQDSEKTSLNYRLIISLLKLPVVLWSLTAI